MQAFALAWSGVVGRSNVGDGRPVVAHVHVWVRLVHVGIGMALYEEVISHILYGDLR